MRNIFCFLLSECTLKNRKFLLRDRLVISKCKDGESGFGRYHQCVRGSTDATTRWTDEINDCNPTSSLFCGQTI